MIRIMADKYKDMLLRIPSIGTEQNFRRITVA
jgi:hypothetical protein